MTPTAQHIALLEWLGWKWKPSNETAFGATEPLKKWHNPEGKVAPTPISPLTLDLLWEAEEKYLKACKTVDERSLWLDYLSVVAGWEGAKSPDEARFLGDLNAAHATKEQRLEALLRTLNLWKEPNQ